MTGRRDARDGGGPREGARVPPCNPAAFSAAPGGSGGAVSGQPEKGCAAPIIFTLARAVGLDLFGEPAPAPARSGRKRHRPVPAMQARVAELRAAGLAIERIAELVKLNKNTLYRHYAEQLGSRSQAGLRYADPVEAARMPRPALGRPRHEPTIATSALVRQLAADGASLTAIAAAVGVTVPTLKRHYGRELRPARLTGGTN